MARVVDFTGVGDFTPAPLGVYTVIGKEYKWRDNADGQGEHCSFQWAIEDDVAADGSTKVAGKILFQTYSPKHNALWKVQQDAIAVGLDPGLFEGNVDLDVVVPAMVGRRGLAEVGIEEYTVQKGPKAGDTRYRNTIVEIRSLEATNDDDAAAAEALSAGAGSRRK